MTTHIDVFPIRFDLEHYPLIAYRIEAANPDEAGGVLAARVRKMSRIPAVWLRGQNCLITSAAFSLEKANALLGQLHQMALPALATLTAITPIPGVAITPAIIAQFVAEGILDLADSEDAVSDALRGDHVTVGKNVQITRQAQFKGLVLDGTTPALQITVRSTMSSQQSLQAYLHEHGEEEVPAGGLEIKCRKTSGTFGGIVGKLDDVASGSMTHRQRLKGYKPTDYPASQLDTLPADHLVVALKPKYGRTIYHFPISVLRLVISMENLHRFLQSPEDQRKAAGHLKLPPRMRYEMVQKVWKGVQQCLSAQGLPVYVDAACNQRSHPALFTTAASLGFRPLMRFRDRTVSINQDSDMLAALRQGGVFHLATPSLRVAIVDAIPGEAHASQRRAQLVRLNTQLKSMSITLERSAPTALMKVEQTTLAQHLRASLRQQMKNAIATGPDIILVYLPDADRKAHSADDGNSLYNVAKNEAVGAGVASQVIYQKTMDSSYADANIIMGILGKTGNIPYILAEPLSFADVIVGLDVSRRRMPNGGALNTGAMSRVFLNDGHMLGYSLANGTILDGETIPPEMLEMLFPPEDFGGKRVIIHRDGRFPNAELDSLIGWGQRIGAEFYPIEVTKSGTPRMYRRLDEKTDQALRQTIFHVDEQTAFIVTSPPPAPGNVAKTTAQPLKIRNLSSLTMNQALLSVFSLTMLHYGSVRPPRLPVSTHASDKIAGFLLRGIRPGQSTGNRPFWL